MLLKDVEKRITELEVMINDLRMQLKFAEKMLLKFMENAEGYRRENEQLKKRIDYLGGNI